MTPIKWTPEQVAKLIGKYERGDTILDMAEAFGVTDEAIAGKLRRLRASGKLARRGIHRNGYSPDRVGATLEELADMYNSGMRWQDISAKLGYSGKDGARLRYYRLLSQADKPDLLSRPSEQPDAPPPAWRDNGLGESIAYQRARERVERYVAAGDDRSAAINQTYMETGVRVR
jgi:hypothetical protein